MKEFTKEEVIEYMELNGSDHVQLDCPEFLNTRVHGYHKSRYIASWLKYGGKFDSHFKEWLLTIKFDDGHMTESEAREICQFARIGKLEFETSARLFMEEHHIT